MLVEGTLCKDVAKIKRQLVSFYKDLYSKKDVHRLIFDEFHLQSLSDQQRINFEKSFTKDEIWYVVFSLAGDKTHGFDGFPLVVYQRAWGFMKNDIMKVVWALQNRGFLDWRINTTFVTLIPKVDGITSVHDYCPIYT